MSKPNSSGEVLLQFSTKGATTLRLADYVQEPSAPLEPFNAAASKGSGAGAYLEQYHDYLVGRLANREVRLVITVLLQCYSPWT